MIEQKYGIEWNSDFVLHREAYKFFVNFLWVTEFFLMLSLRSHKILMSKPVGLVKFQKGDRRSIKFPKFFAYK